MASFSETLRHGADPHRAAADGFFRDHGWAQSPRLVQWMLTGECSLHCPHCLSAGTGALPGLPWKSAVSLIEQIAALTVDELLLTGGEPLARPDFPEIIALLATHRIRWSLNTAIMPTVRQQAALEKWPPVFVAVSLDGPPAIHDWFRGQRGAFAQAMDSIQYFADLIPNNVVAGTTVTSVNFPHLPETFGLVLESRAAAWGLHLLVPEGRAAQHPELRLTRRQLKQLLAFAAAKRNHFPVTMADEIGYCGYWEPLVREEPFFCGAGKLQCVVLPDGEVVPCSTTDPAASAGNIQTRSLKDIWETGFGELRQQTASDRCAQCAYAPACQGGCWLQRRHGTECFRDVWHMPQAFTTAGAIVCLGLATAANAAAPVANPPLQQTSPPAVDKDAREMEILQSAIIQWYAAETGGHRAPNREQVIRSLQESLSNDPAAKFFLRFINRQIPEEIPALGKEIESSLQTQQRSLCLIGLVWRSLTEWCLDRTPPQQRTLVEKTALRQALTVTSITAEAWRKQIFEQKLDPFLRQTSDYRRFYLSKAGPPPQARLAQNVAGKRGWTTPNLTIDFLAAHPYAEVMNLEVEASAALVALRRGERQSFDGKLGVFDLLLIPDGAVPMTVTLKKTGQSYNVDLPAGTELTYGDVLRLTYEQNQEALDKLANQWLKSGGSPSQPLALPALRAMRQTLEGQNPVPPERRTIEWLLADLYLF